MGDDDTEARRERATRLREQIKRITGRTAERPSTQQDDATGQNEGARRNAPRVRPPSPREFIGQRMRELARNGR